MNLSVEPVGFQLTMYMCDSCSSLVSNLLGLQAVTQALHEFWRLQYSGRRVHINAPQYSTYDAVMITGFCTPNFVCLNIQMVKMTVNAPEPGQDVFDIRL